MPSHAIVLAVFFASGFSALVYQVVWVEMFGRVFGITTLAASAVLGVYFGGLALGGYLGGVFVEGRNGLRLYGLIQVALGLSALAVPRLFDLLSTAYRAIHPYTADREILLIPVRLLLSCAAILVPAVFVGMGLPVLVRTLVSHYDEMAQRLPRLYAGNTLGSVLGVLLTGYVLLGFLGLNQTNNVAVGVSIAAGAVALWLSRSILALHSGASSAPVQPRRDECTLDRAWRKTALTVTFCSGFAALGYEVVWFRVLASLSDHRAHTFSAIVAVVLAGIAAGSLAVVRVNRRAVDPSVTLAAVLLSLGLAGIAWLPLVVALSSAFAAASSVFLAPPTRSGVAFVVSILVTFFPCFLMGMSFPLAVQLHSLHTRHIGTGVGRMYASNLIGAACGSLFTGFVLVPALGAQRSLFSLSFVCLLASALLHYRGARGKPLRMVAGTAAAAAILWLLWPAKMLDLLFVRVYPHTRVLHSYEDIESTVMLVEQESRLAMYVNGAHQADDSPWTIGVHRLIGLIPCLVHGHVSDSLVIGMGGGTTAGEVARCSASTTIVELSPGVVRAARAFGTQNRDIADSPRAHTVIADGRNFLLVSDRKFDLITADTIRPIHANSGNLYSREYYRLMSSRLKENGIVLQWIDVSLRDHEERILMRTFVGAFAHVAMFELGGNKFLVGSNERRVFDAEAIRGRLTPSVIDDLAAAGVESAESFLSGVALTGDDLRAAIGTGPVITDDRPLNEYFGLLRTADMWRLLPSETSAYRPGL